MEMICKSWEELAVIIGGIQAASILIEKPQVRYISDLKGRWVKIIYINDHCYTVEEVNLNPKGGE